VVQCEVSEEAKLDARFVPLPRRVGEDGRRVAVCGAPALRRPDGGAYTIVTTTSLVGSIRAHAVPGGTHEYSDDRPEAPCNRGRDGDGRRIRPSLPA
jgi:hypothetical protein